MGLEPSFGSLLHGILKSDMGTILEGLVVKYVRLYLLFKMLFTNKKRAQSYSILGP